VDYSDSKGEIAEKMADSSVVYLTGGQPSILIERLKTKGVDELLRGFGGVIVGRSAGALALCSRCISTTRRLRKVRIVSGLGLVDVTLKAHYVSSDEETLKSFSLKEEIFALPEKSALVCENAKLSVIGTVYLFSNGKLFTLKKLKS
jgi:peptidase E